MKVKVKGVIEDLKFKKKKKWFQLILGFPAGG